MFTFSSAFLPAPLGTNPLLLWLLCYTLVYIWVYWASLYCMYIVLVVSFVFPMHLLARLFPLTLTLSVQISPGLADILPKMAANLNARDDRAMYNQSFSSLWVRLSVHIARILRWVDLGPIADHLQKWTRLNRSQFNLEFTLRPVCHRSVWDRSNSLVWTRPNKNMPIVEYYFEGFISSVR